MTRKLSRLSPMLWAGVATPRTCTVPMTAPSTLISSLPVAVAALGSFASVARFLKMSIAGTGLGAKVTTFSALVIAPSLALSSTVSRSSLALSANSSLASVSLPMVSLRLVFSTVSAIRR